MANEREEAGVGKKKKLGVLAPRSVLNKQFHHLWEATVMALSTLDPEHSVELNPLLLTSPVTLDKILDLSALWLFGLYTGDDNSYFLKSVGLS